MHVWDKNFEKNKDPKIQKGKWGIKYLGMYRIKFSKKFVHVWDKNFEKNKDPKIQKGKWGIK